MTHYVTARFAARYNSTCVRCRKQIRAGDTCTWVDDKPVHADCEAAQ